MDDKLQYRIKGAIYGHLVGDVRGHRQESVDQSPGVYTDRGSMLLCTIGSINEMNGIDTEDIMTKFRDFYVGGYMTPEGECFQISEAVSQSIKNYCLGMPPDRCGVKDDASTDNNALSRILPIALYCASSSTDEIVRQSHEVTAITHNNLISKVCSALYSLLIRSLMLQKGEKVFDILAKHYKDNKMESYSSALTDVKNWVTAAEIKGTSSVLDTFWSSWQCYSKHQTEFQHCMTACFKFGRNSGALGCLAGGLAGLTVGINDIPESWMRELKLKDETTEEINRFVQHAVQRVF